MDLSELKKIVEEENVVFGTDRTLKLLKQGKITSIILAADSDRTIVDRIRKLSQKVSVTQLDKSKEDIREICKKPFNISVLSVVSEKKTAKKSK